MFGFLRKFKKPKSGIGKYKTVVVQKAGDTCWYCGGRGSYTPPRSWSSRECEFCEDGVTIEIKEKRLVKN